MDTATTRAHGRLFPMLLAAGYELPGAALPLLVEAVATPAPAQAGLHPRRGTGALIEVKARVPWWPVPAHLPL